MTYPGDLRKTPIIRTENLLVEALFATESGHTRGMIVSKSDGNAGYGLGVNAEGKAEFFIASGGQRAAVATPEAVNDGQWHHVIGEIDRESGRMTIYLDGQKAGESQAAIGAEASLDNPADLLVGQTANGEAGFSGALDFLRICRGTLEDSHTDIAELYEWQTNGPFRKDFMGRDFTGERRDIGALERL
ncbi:MAG: LamG domain-containing protein [Opitutales bacterium]